MRYVSLLAVALASAAPAWANGFDPKTVDFAVSVQGDASAYRETSVFVLPGETVAVEAIGGPPGDYVLTTPVGVAIQTAVRKWQLTAPPHPGLYALRLGGPGKKKDTP